MTSSADNDKNKFLIGIITTRNIFIMIVSLAPIIAGWFVFYIQKTSYMLFELNFYVSPTIGFICLLLSLISIFILRKYFNRYREIINDMPEADFHTFENCG